MVHGDTTTTFAAALAAFYRMIPVAHVEAGLRTDDIYSPYPEEINRRLADRLAEIYYAPTAAAREALLREGRRRERILVTGNTVIDALLATAATAPPAGSRPWPRPWAGPAPRCWSRSTAGRAGERPWNRVAQAIKHVCERMPELTFIFPIHLNPVVRATFRGALGEVEPSGLHRAASLPALRSPHEGRRRGHHRLGWDPGGGAYSGQARAGDARYHRAPRRASRRAPPGWSAPTPRRSPGSSWCC